MHPKLKQAKDLAEIEPDESLRLCNEVLNDHIDDVHAQLEDQHAAQKHPWEAAAAQRADQGVEHADRDEDLRDGAEQRKCRDLHRQRNLRRSP